MIEGIIVIVGLFFTISPAIMYFTYLLKHVKRKTSFDYHVELVKDKKGKKGIIIAYLERILFGTLICIFGILLSEFFKNELALKLFVLNLVIYIIVKYFDVKNEN